MSLRRCFNPKVVWREGFWLRGTGRELGEFHFWWVHGTGETSLQKMVIPRQSYELGMMLQFPGRNLAVILVQKVIKPGDTFHPAYSLWIVFVSFGVMRSILVVGQWMSGHCGVFYFWGVLEDLSG